MEKLDISLPEQIQAFVDEQVSTGGYSNASEYIQHLLIQEQERIAKKRVEMLLVEGLESGEPIEVTPEWWEQKRFQLMNRLH
ncbi:MAG: type II toxin-antitoxin system ParD family antitoxin [Cyanomargarita calcarea GSE-NOS-MK-12-04C]|jgi:antitoxin ParD1/3/4|uniref:Type II toxin-antitoxin system ParD family antitoxin n=1 Tax=Cyanomargarita calcarea GSE-NOS-MK-12-04C TaxID=2839659 RepID=A0A951QKM2_9CYAN|nr:type II toxin-antitoxin system ParD family antitoxin [Cyanomargarita calcarea GSE-NOS-MK-12-04C]